MNYYIQIKGNNKWISAVNFASFIETSRTHCLMGTCHFKCTHMRELIVVYSVGLAWIFVSPSFDGVRKKFLVGANV